MHQKYQIVLLRNSKVIQENFLRLYGLSYFHAIFEGDRNSYVINSSCSYKVVLMYLLNASMAYYLLAFKSLPKIKTSTR